MIQVKKRQSENKFVAKVLAVGHECDIAVLQVEDDSFWDNIEPLEFGGIPDLQEDVSVIGYPVGGERYKARIWELYSIISLPSLLQKPKKKTLSISIVYV